MDQQKYIEALEYRGYKEVEFGYCKQGEVWAHNVSIYENKVQIYSKFQPNDFDTHTVYDTGVISVNINEFIMLLDLFWREHEEN